ncbi:YPDG domain-containing protein, partial [Auritidibacter ignavus]|uniref:YPDG domain-containing protein n=1 Tax=Auritidibacter ignavus TaxID=678932 RepID=UPI001CB6EDFD
MTEVSKNSSGQLPAWRRGAMAAFTAFALVGGGVVCDVTQANVARADQAAVPTATDQTGEAMVPKKVNPEGATDRYPRATNPQGTRPAPVASEVTGPVDADVIAAGRVRTYGQFADVTNRGLLGTFSGRLYFSNGVSFDASNSGAAALNDVTLYLQWMDKDSPASPVFTAKTHNLAGTDGAFGFGDLNWVDENGTLHVYEPRNLINDVRIKVWVAPGQTGPGGGELKAIRQGPGMMNGFMNPGRDGYFGSFTTEPFSTQRGSVWVYEQPEGADPASYLTTPRDQWKVDNEGPVPTPSNTSGLGGNGPNMVSGRVWWESGDTDLNIAFPFKAGESPAPGTRVVMSVLSEEGRSAIRGLGNLPTGERIQQQKALLEANPQYIEQTVVAPVGDNGQYTVRFDQRIPKADALYGFVINADDEIVAGYTPWTVPAFGDPNDGPHTAAFWQLARGSLYNVFFALVPDPNRADISLDHDTGANTAGVGDVVTPSVDTVFYPGQNYAIRWVDENGDQVGQDCEITSATEAANCTFTVPDDAEPGAVYQARLIINGNIMDSASFRVTEYAERLEPAYEDVSGVPGEQVSVPAPSFTDADGAEAEVPEGTSFQAGENAPEGVTIDESTGEITFTVPEGATPGETIEIPVVVTYPDGSTDEVVATITVDEPVADQFAPVWGDETVAPGESVTVPNSGDELSDDAEVTASVAEEGWEVTVGDDHSVIVTAPEDATDGDEVTVEVTVTYPDGSTDTETFTVTVEEPGVVSYPDVTVGDDDEDRQVSVDPVITDAEGNPAETGEGDRFEFGELPDGFVKDPSDESGNTIVWDGGTEDPADDITVVIDPDTGEITVDAGEDADTDGPVEIPVRVVDQDGEPTFEGSVTLDVDPKAAEQAETFEPAYEDASGVPGEQVSVPAPSFTDADGAEAEVPEGTSFQAGENAPEGVTIDESTGEITFTVPEGATPGETIEIPVVVTYPDGSTDEVTVTVTVDEPDNGGGQEDTLADITTPTWENGTVEPGGSVDIPNSGDQLPEGSKVEATADAEGWKVSATDDGTLTVTAPEGAADGDKATIEVTVTYPDGSQDVEKVTVTVNDPNGGGDDDEAGTQADDITPTWVNSQVAPGESVEVPNTGEEIPEGSTVETSTDAEGWQVSATNDGTLTVAAPEGASHGEKAVVTVQVTYPDGSVDTEQVSVTVVDPTVGDDDDNNNQAAEVQPNWDNQEVAPGESVTAPNNGDALPEGSEVEATSSQDGWNVTVGDDHGITVTAPENASTGDKTTITVTVTYPDGSTDTETFTVTVNDPSGDTGGDQASEVTPNWDNTTVQPGQTVEVPNNGDELPDGSQVEVSSDQDGWTVEVGEDGSTIKVTAPEGATPGDKTEITVTVTYPDGSTDTETFTVTVTDPSDGGEGPGEQEKPNWSDAEGEPGEQILIPNDGGEVPEGTTVEVEGPGSASIDEDGNLVVEINEDAKPGDTIVVVVKDKDGNVIDEITVTVT